MGAWLAILSAAAVNTFTLLRNDRKLFSRDTLSGLSYLFGRHGVISGLTPAFLAYFRRDFHPWQHADGAATRRWQAENARYIQNLHELTPAA